MVTTEVIWLQSLLRELNLTLSVPIPWCDNFGVIFLASNSVFHTRNKQIELDNHFVHEKITYCKNQVKFICSQDQLVDALTKPLYVACFQTIRSKLIVNSLTYFA
jgi:hypothetical protein